MTISLDGMPPGWALSTLPELIGPDGIFSDGDWVESKDQDPDGDVRLIQLADIGEGVFRDRSNRFLTSYKAAELNCTFLRPGDVLVARMPDPLGRACIFPGTGRKSVTAVDVCIIRPGSGSVEPRWLMWIINAPQFRRAIAELQSGTTRGRISRKNLGRITLPVAPLAEQRCIVAAIEEQFSRIDAGIAALQRAKANLNRYRTSVFRDTSQGRLVPTEAEVARREGRDFEPASALLKHILKERRAQREDQPGHRGTYREPQPPDTGNLPPLPEGWVWASVGQVGESRLGRQRSPKHHRGPNMRPYLRAANVFDGRLDLSDVKQMNFNHQEFKEYALRYGDVLLNEGQSPELIGRAAIYRDEIPGVCFQNTLVRFRAPQGLVPEYALHVFRAYLHTRRFMREARITTNIAHLGLERFVRMEFPLPPFIEQRRIVAEVEWHLSVIEAAEATVEANLKRAERLRQVILQRAFEGRLASRDPSDEPAEVLLDRIEAARMARQPRTPRLQRRSRR